MSRTAKWVVTVASIAIAVSLVIEFTAPPYFGFGAPKQSPSRNDADPSQDSAVASSEFDHPPSPTPTDVQAGSDLGRFLDCNLYAASRRDADLFLIDRWQESIGNRTTTSDRSYFQLPEETLVGLSENGDGQAALALGLNLWARAYNQGPTWPLGEFEFIQVTPRWPEDAVLDTAVLADARAQMYRAAQLGKPGALTDLFFSFGHERRWHERQGTLTPERSRALRIEAFAYAKLYETLFTDTDGGTTQSRIDEEDKAAAEARAAEVIAQFSRDQYAVLGTTPLYSQPQDVEDAGDRVRAFFRQCDDVD